MNGITWKEYEWTTAEKNISGGITWKEDEWTAAEKNMSGQRR